MVDFDLEIKKVHSINMREIELNRYMIDDNIKKSIILYNTAIGELNKGNFDLVINDLKKSLSYNEGFTEAINLCYVKMKEYKKAEKIFKKLDKYGIYNKCMENLSINKSMAEGIILTEAAPNMSNDKKKSYSLVKNSKRSVL